MIYLLVVRDVRVMGWDSQIMDSNFFSFGLINHERKGATSAFRDLLKKGEEIHIKDNIITLSTSICEAIKSTRVPSLSKFESHFSLHRIL